MWNKLAPGVVVIYHLSYGPLAAYKQTLGYTFYRFDQIHVRFTLWNRTALAQPKRLASMGNTGDETPKLSNELRVTRAQYMYVTSYYKQY
jgi:hypothetical protein